MIDALIKKGWNSPQKLALVHTSLFQAALEGSPHRELATQLWTATVLLFADLSSASFLLLKGVSADAERLITALRMARLASKLFMLT